jgi:ubiquinone/menaquinone biosynthesis C-methylase UbiE
MRSRVATIRRLAEENGVEWVILVVLRTAMHRLAGRIDRRMRSIEIRGGRPGNNSRQRNYERWQAWDWSLRGEEWTESPAWKASLVEDVMKPAMAGAGVILEIGPGAGRWTEELRRLAPRLVVVDLSDRCIELCRERFGDAHNIEYHVNDGRSLTFLADGSVDRLWSFDVFVHIAGDDIASYLREIGRVLAPGGRGVIHHADRVAIDDVAAAGWRSRVSAADFARHVEAAGMAVTGQFDTWGHGAAHGVRDRRDMITTFERPARGSTGR